jgi:hypothetical protein
MRILNLETRDKKQELRKKEKGKVPSTMYHVPRRGKEFVDVLVGGER